MISKRLTKIQKNEILEAYQSGENTNILAEKYSCSSNTINRTVKMQLSGIEYKLLKEQRVKSQKKGECANNEILDIKQEDFEQPNTSNSLQSKVNEKEESIRTDEHLYNSEFEEIAFLPIEGISSHDCQNYSNDDFDKKELEFEILNKNILPESVYMLVDKKVELDVKSISELTEWSFLPEKELQRNAILLFSNQRTAKRSCSRNQRVIKIPNTSVFEVSKSYLVSKGITRLILEDSLIALDN